MTSPSFPRLDDVLHSRRFPHASALPGTGKKPVLWKGFVVGLAAGFAGTAAMTLFQLVWLRAKSEVEKRNLVRAGQQSNGQPQQSETSTVKIANIISKTVLHRPLWTDEKERASYAVHFAFGTAMGGLYGISSEYLRIARLGHGLLHGLGLWAGADATVVPALKLSSPIAQRSATELTYEILAHAVYGMSSESARRFLRERLDN